MASIFTMNVWEIIIVFEQIKDFVRYPVMLVFGAVEMQILLQVCFDLPCVKVGVSVNDFKYHIN